MITQKEAENIVNSVRETSEYWIAYFDKQIKEAAFRGDSEVSLSFSPETTTYKGFREANKVLIKNNFDVQAVPDIMMGVITIIITLVKDGDEQNEYLPEDDDEEVS